MMKFTYISGEDKVTVSSNNVETTEEAMRLFCNFLRGVSFIIDEDMEQALVEVLQQARADAESNVYDENPGEEYGHVANPDPNSY